MTSPLYRNNVEVQRKTGHALQDQLNREAAVDQAIAEKVPTHNPNMVFSPLDDELFREYVFVRDGVKVPVRIDNPLALHVAKSGSHRVLDSQNKSHYIPPGWIHLSWETKTDYGFLY